jgi:hypothetical protein
MIVFDLRCGHGHVFEAWFGSSGAFEEQRTGGLVACPICGDVAVSKAVMAPNVAAKGNRAVAATPAGAGPEPATVKAALAALAAAQAKALATSEWVGPAFASRARAMHAGDTPEAAIHGQATLAEARALVEDGVPVAPLLVPVVPPEACN